MELIGRYIYAIKMDRPELKTEVWHIRTKDAEIALGTVKWLGKWRCYAFFPCEQTIYEHRCLRDIANFCENKTKEHRLALTQDRLK